MDKQDLIREKNKLERVKKSLYSVKSYLNNPDIIAKLSKAKYILSKDYLINDKNSKIESLENVINSRDTRINTCNEIINSINVRLNNLTKSINELD